MTSKTSNLLNVNQADFQRNVLESDVPVLVDFWADWCQPCHMVAPVIEQLADEFAGRVKVVKIDTDANRDLATEYSINSIPTILLFKDGKVVERVPGVRSQSEYTSALNALLE